MKNILRMMAFALLLASQMRSQEITGDWQGSRKGDLGRIILHIERTEGGGLRGSIWPIDVVPDSLPVTSVTFSGSTLTFSIEVLDAVFSGTLSSNQQSIAGRWVQDGHAAAFELVRPTKADTWPRDPAPHSIQFVTVDTNIRLEVLDFGGSGRALVFLTGLGNTAHILDTFAPNFVSKHHVYAITRRGFGSSSAPAAGYSAERLGDDVVEVLKFLKLDRPVLAGHSIAGEELSSIATRHPEFVSGLIYLDAAYAAAFYNPAYGDLNLDSLTLQKKFTMLRAGSGVDPMPLIQELLQTDLPQLQKDLEEERKDLQFVPAQDRKKRLPSAYQSVIAGEEKFNAEKFKDVRLPVLAIYAIPRSGVSAPSDSPDIRAAAQARDNEVSEVQLKAFATGVPNAHIVRLPNANHYIFLSNSGDVWREMNNFMSELK